MSLSDLRRGLGLASFGVRDVLELFAMGTNDDGMLTRDTFRACASRLPPAAGVSDAQREQLVDALFDVFDTSGDEVVDYSEVSSALTLLCGGSREEKLEAAYSLVCRDKHKAYRG